jgi:YesN/AraC family two-component response regulator
LIEYVNKRRIDQAKLLLMESDVAINDMTDKLGFTNSNTFIRVFKKYEGITPGQFRQNHAKS